MKEYYLVNKFFQYEYANNVSISSSNVMISIRHELLQRRGTLEKWGVVARDKKVVMQIVGGGSCR